MKQKFLLIGAIIILFILIIVTTLVGNAINKNNEKTQQNYAAFNNLIGVVFGKETNSATGQQQSSFYPSKTTEVTPTKSMSDGSAFSSSPSSYNPVYYPQCEGPYDNIQLPDGCNMCDAGCGPSSVAMILSSYIDKKYTPPVVADLYKQNGLAVGCQGTNILDGQTILSTYGMKTTDLIYYENSSTDEVAADMKTYIQNGWTLYTLVEYCPKGCGHFFWVTNVDANNMIWAYDPGDARRPVPLNENSVVPAAKFYLAIGVKKQ